MSNRMNNPRVVHAPYDVGGNAYYLSRAERAYGFASETLVYFNQWFGYPTDRTLRMKPGANPWKNPRWWLAMLDIAMRSDVLHFNFGGSFLTDINRGWVYADLPLWKRLGIPAFVTFQGCDSRLSQYSLEHFPINACAGCRSREFCHSTYDNFRAECLSQVGRYFDGIFALNPDLLHNIPNGQFLPYSNCDLDKWVPPVGYDWHHAGPVRIAHAPTWRDIKGSDYIIRAVEELRSEGENVELLLVENTPHAQVRAMYERADLLVDQVLVGWYGGLAVELMALGKPVVAYVRESDLRFIPRAMREELPVVSADPSTLKEVLRPLVRDSERRRQLGQRSRTYAENWHHPRVVAGITTAAYRAALEKRGPRRPVHRRVIIVKEHVAPVVRDLTALYVRHAAVKRIFCQIINRLAHYCVIMIVLLARAMTWLRLRFGTPRSVWGTTPIVTITPLSRADRLIGVRGETMVYTTYYITNAFDRVLKASLDRVCRWLPGLLPAFYEFVFLRALLRYDVFHYFYDQGFLPREGRFGVNPWELKILRVAGKRVYLYAYGADVRTREATLQLGKYNCCTHCDRVGGHCLCDDAEGQRKQAVYQKLTTARLSMGDMMTYVPGARNLYYWPFDVEAFPYVGTQWDGQRPLRILHVPNHEWAKGSKYLVQSLERLRERGVPFTLIQASKKSNTEILRLMSEADIIADQFLIGWHGYTALEALALGKVVLCFLRDQDVVLRPDLCPIISTNPDTLDATLTDLASWSPAKLHEVGRAGRRYVEECYSVQAMAKRLAKLYLDTGGFPKRLAERLRKASDAIVLPRTMLLEEKQPSVPERVAA